LGEEVAEMVLPDGSSQEMLDGERGAVGRQHLVQDVPQEPLQVSLKGGQGLDRNIGRPGSIFLLGYQKICFRLYHFPSQITLFQSPSKFKRKERESARCLLAQIFLTIMQPTPPSHRGCLLYVTI
jgi:hypothetical protein